MLLKFFKKLDCRNCINIPIETVKKMGREYYMEIYEDKIVLIPKGKEKEKDN